MPIPTGTRVGPYEVTAAIGAGAMGEVYRARDTALNRDVAIKVLLEHLADDADGLMRFDREAQALAALNHRNIAQIYGLERFDDGTGPARRAIVMELVQGPTLADRIAAGPIPRGDVFAIATQIAQALEAAHDRGIVHRDLKPGNVKVTDDGTVKVLDFGLAKALEWPLPGATDPANSATVTSEDTRPGVILGTPAYMSPEQARGRPADARADVWAFGVVVWEMLAGRRPFTGDTSGDVLAAVLRDDPDYASLPRDVPPAILRLLRRCLRRDAARRLRHLGDARLELEEAVDAPAVAEERPGSDLGRGGLVERSWILTTDVCRDLDPATLDPAVIGDHVRYADNERPSDVLVVFVPGFGFDHGVFREVLERSPHRAIAVSLYGFEDTRRRRMPLPIVSHLTILRRFLESVVGETQPGTTLLCGFSSGADVVMRVVAEAGLTRDTVDGILVLSPNLSLDTCWFSRRVAAIPPHRDGEILDLAREVAGAMETPQAWLHVTPYLMELVRKYHADIDALRQHGHDIMAPFVGAGDSPFAGWYRAVKHAGIRARIVFAGGEDDEQRGLGTLRLAHVTGAVLGPDFADADLVNEPDASHMDLMKTEVIERQIQAMAAQRAEGRRE